MFNLKKAKSSEENRHRLEQAWSLLPFLTDDERTEMSALVSHLASTKVAVHGHGDTFDKFREMMPQSPQNDPYNTSDLVKPKWQGQSGDRWRPPLPSNSSAINKDSDTTPESTRGNAGEGDFQEGARDQKVNDALGGDKNFVVRIRDGHPLTKQLVDQLTEKGFKQDGNAMYMVVNTPEEASRLQRDVPGAIVEERKKR